MRAGDVGQIEIVTITSRDPAPPSASYVRRSGGLYRDSMIHDFDEAGFLLGEESIEVYAVGSCMVDPEIGAAGDVDTAAVVMCTASGAICQISLSRRATYGDDQRVEVLGSNGSPPTVTHTAPVRTAVGHPLHIDRPRTAAEG